MTKQSRTITSGVSEELFEVAPDYVRVVTRARGATPDRTEMPPPSTCDLLEAAGRVIDGAKDDPWHALYARLGQKPKKHRPAHLNLASAVTRRGAMPRIHPVVDAMNVVSLSVGVPVGGDDVTKGGDTYNLRRAIGDETFRPIGDGDQRTVPAGEVVYVAESTNVVCCRRWNWRNSRVTALDAASDDVLINIDVLSGPDVAEKAASMLVALLAGLGFASLDVSMIDRHRPLATFEG